MRSKLIGENSKSVCSGEDGPKVVYPVDVPLKKKKLNYLLNNKNLVLIVQITFKIETNNLIFNKKFEH